MENCLPSARYCFRLLRRLQSHDAGGRGRREDDGAAANTASCTAGCPAGCATAKSALNLLNQVCLTLLCSEIQAVRRATRRKAFRTVGLERPQQPTKHYRTSLVNAQKITAMRASSLGKKQARSSWLPCLLGKENERKGRPGWKGKSRVGGDGPDGAKSKRFR